MGNGSTQPVVEAGRIAGKWQIPAFLLSAGLLAAVILSIKSPDRKITLPEHIRSIDAMLANGAHGPALDRVGRLLAWTDLKPSERAELQLRQARATGVKAEATERGGEETGTEALRLYEEALKAGATLTAEDYAQVARICERLGEAHSAVENYRRAIELGEGPGLAYRRRIIELSEYPLRVASNELERLLGEFVVDAVDSAPDQVWALERQLDLLAEERRWDDAARLLDEFASRLAGTTYAAEIEYLQCLNLWHAGRYDDAEVRVRELLNRLSYSDPVCSRAKWLLGRVVLYDGQPQRPEEALAIFREVVGARGDKEYMAASRLGEAEALADLQRYDEAAAVYREVLAGLGRAAGTKLVNREVIRTSVAALGERLWREGELGSALEFTRLAESLTPENEPALLAGYLQREGDLLTALARRLRAEGKDKKSGEAAERAAKEEEARKLLGEAGDAFIRLGRLSTLNEDQSSGAMWEAASLLEEGGHSQRSIEVLKAFAQERPLSARLPRVLLRLGRALQREGRYEEAIETFQSNFARHPRAADANASLLPLAECFMELGEEHDGEAEQALQQIIRDSDIYTPEAAEYREAMFLLGDLYSRGAQAEKAIPVLEEAIENYGKDPRAIRAMLLLADVYRQTAAAIKEELTDPQYVGERNRLRAERELRIREAARRYGELVDRLGAREEELDEREQLYLRDARLYEADCWFEQQKYKEALALYERAAWIYKDLPAALGAYVQVINCYVFLGQEDEARAALRRAQYLVESIPESAYQADGQFETRDGWKQYFEWVADLLGGGAIARSEPPKR